MTMLRVDACPICGSSELRPYAASSFRDNQLHFAQVRCGRCGLLIAQPQASAEDMDRYYRRAYYEGPWSDEDVLYKYNALAHQRATMPVLQRLCGDVLRAPSRILEIGCGYGSLLGLLADAGHHAFGMDLSLKAASFCRRNGLPVAVGRFPQVPFEAGNFDLVIARHVIEHLPDPRGFVHAMLNLARPGGAIAIETENAHIAQYRWDRARAFVCMRIPPFRSSTDHTFVFGPEHLRGLMNEAGCEHVAAASFTEMPEHESIHWRAYKGFFRALDRLAGGGELVLAVGRRPRATIH
jgi:2-polyprenyl-3-methyl-5-hydroxy-6-metoxy-1,4-benzoquinol methylase